MWSPPSSSSSSCNGGGGAGQLWLERRRDMPRALRDDGAFTDVTLVAVDADSGEERSFQAHRLVLACHSEYFLNLLSCGMRESEERVVRFGHGGGAVDARVLQRALDYIYTGRLADDLSFEETRSLLMAANMWQMEDLEAAALHSLLAKCDTPQRCLKVFLFVREAEEALFGGGGGAKGGSGGSNLTETVMAAVKRDLEQMLVKIVRDRWHIILSPANHVEAAAGDDYVMGLTDLDVSSLKVILSIKSDQEEVSDFSFSFNQVDILLAILQWIKADFQSRHKHLHDLSEYYCHHQINSQPRDYLRDLVRRVNEFCSVHELRTADPASCDTDARLDVDLPECRGFWCPHRRIPGLIIAHAWSPHANNRITCDHVYFYFTIPKLMGTAAKARPLHNDFFYDLGQFGELGEGEKHLLVPNNCPLLPSVAAHMLLTFDGGSLSGTLVDPVKSRFACPRHYSNMFRFCPSVIKECSCEYFQMTICASLSKDEDDIDRVNVVGCTHCHGSLDAASLEEISFDPHCDTFRLIPSPPWPSCVSTRDGGGDENSRSFVSGRTSTTSEHELLALGGYVVQSGENFSYAHCTFDLQDFGGYKSGHSHLKTSIGYLRDTPMPHLFIHKLNLDLLRKNGKPSWSDGGDTLKLPVPLGDPAAAVYQDELWLIGGFVVNYDEDHKLFYQEPLRESWVYSFDKCRWRRGPSLPRDGDADGDVWPEAQEAEEQAGAQRRLSGGSMRGTAYVKSGKIFYSGGACLKVNSASESNQIYEYVPNSRVFVLEHSAELGADGDSGGDGIRRRWRWRVLLDLSYFASKFAEVDYTVLAVIPADITLTRLKVRRDVNAVSKFQVKYLNINLSLGQAN